MVSIKASKALHEAGTDEITDYLKSCGRDVRVDKKGGHTLIRSGRLAILPAYRSTDTYHRNSQRWEQSVGRDVIDWLFEYQRANPDQRVLVAVYVEVGPEKHEPYLRGVWPAIRYQTVKELGKGRRPLNTTSGQAYFPVSSFKVRIPNA